MIHAGLDLSRKKVLLHAEVRHAPPPGWPEPGPFVGRDAVMAHFGQLREAFSADTVELLEMAPVPGGILVRMVRRGTGLGPAAEIEMWQVTRVCDGLVLSLEQFRDLDEAPEATRQGQ